MDAIKIIEESKAIHIEWAVYFEKYPYMVNVEGYKKLGDASFHRACIEKYDRAIAEIKELQTELEEARTCIDDLNEYM